MKINKVSMAMGLLSLVLIFLAGCEKKTNSPSPVVKIGDKTWQVEIARTEKERYQGLSGRDEIPDGRGMLFLYPRAKNLSFCMRGCKIPIDIVFVGPNCRVVNIFEMQVEPDLAGRVGYSSNLPAQYALELTGGAAAQAGIAIGDLVEFIDVPDPNLAERGD